MYCIGFVLYRDFISFYFLVFVVFCFALRSLRSLCFVCYLDFWLFLFFFWVRVGYLFVCLVVCLVVRHDIRALTALHCYGKHWKDAWEGRMHGKDALMAGICILIAFHGRCFLYSRLRFPGGRSGWFRLLVRSIHTYIHRLIDILYSTSTDSEYNTIKPDFLLGRGRLFSLFFTLRCGTSFFCVTA